MPKLGPYSNCATLAKLDGRTREARLVKSLRAELVAHVGGNPSTTQRLLIDQACALQLRIALMDADSERIDVMTERNQVQYLAWSGALTRLLDKIGLKAAAAPKPTHAEWLANIARTLPTVPVPAAPDPADDDDGTDAPDDGEAALADPARTAA
jgi:hypothetical protein